MLVEYIWCAGGKFGVPGLDIGIQHTAYEYRILNTEYRIQNDYVCGSAAPASCVGNNSSVVPTEDENKLSLTMYHGGSIPLTLPLAHLL